MKYLSIAALIFLLASCGKEAAEAPQTESSANAEAAPVETKSEPENTLAAILDSQPEDAKARYEYRRPKETLELFEIEPGMTVAEMLPGRGWYSKILIPYIGDAGKLIGLSYPMSLAEEIFPPRFQEFFKNFATTWPQDMQEAGATGAALSAHAFGALPDELNGTVDRAIFIRALHHFGRVDGYMDSAIGETFALLKPGGLVGIVQHQSPENMSDDWANGAKGYLKKSRVIADFEKAGFVLKTDSPLNSNAKDVPGEDDNVWRLPPSLRVEDDDEELKAQMREIGESNRMTLVFEKPAA